MAVWPSFAPLMNCISKRQLKPIIICQDGFPIKVVIGVVVVDSEYFPPLAVSQLNSQVQKEMNRLRDRDRVRRKIRLFIYYIHIFYKRVSDRRVFPEIYRQLLDAKPYVHSRSWKRRGREAEIEKCHLSF